MLNHNREEKARATTFVIAEKRNKEHGAVRARGHVFSVIKCQFGYCKTRYCGIKKNSCQITLMARLFSTLCESN